MINLIKTNPARLLTIILTIYINQSMIMHTVHPRVKHANILQFHPKLTNFTKINLNNS